MFGTMNRKRLSFILAPVLCIVWSMPASADQTDNAEQFTLPRSFEGARLGMTRNELSLAVPEADKTVAKTGRQAGRTVVLPARKDPYVGRIEYRFFQGALQDIVIHYKGDRVPRGYDGLLDKLKDSYGKPIAQNIVEYDPKADVFFVKKTVWKDDATAIVLSELRRMRRGEEVSDIVITMTDLALQEASQRQEEERRRKKEFAVPIPLEDQPVQSRKSSDSGSARSHNGSNS
jgi:hypothetical protein